MMHTLGVSLVRSIMLALGSALWTSLAGAQTVVAPGGLDLHWDYQGRLAAAGSRAHSGKYFHADGVDRVLEEHDGSVAYYLGTSFEVHDGIAVIHVRHGEHIIARKSDTSLQVDVLDDLAVNPGSQARIDAGDAWVSTRLPQHAASRRYLYASARRLLLEHAAGAVSLHSDPLGSLTLATGPEGQPLGERAFHATGQERAGHGLVDRDGFTGKRHDPTTDLVHLPFRELEVEAGRWLSPDPLFLVDARLCLARPFECANGYHYVLNNPVDAFDPTGAARVLITLEAAGGGRMALEQTNGSFLLVDLLDNSRRGLNAGTPRLFTLVGLNEQDALEQTAEWLTTIPNTRSMIFRDLEPRTVMGVEHALRNRRAMWDEFYHALATGSPPANLALERLEVLMTSMATLREASHGNPPLRCQRRFLGTVYMLERGEAGLDPEGERLDSLRQSAPRRFGEIPPVRILRGREHSSAPST
ncbi:MAG: RHS repeat-associated core domain-containing protein [Myxococcales bacterium]